MKLLIKLLVFLITISIILEMGLRISPNLKTYSEKNFGRYTSAFGQKSKHHLSVWNKNDTTTITQTEFEYSYITNEHGLLKERSKKDISADTLVFLGDSFTFGVGAPQDSSITTRLQKQLNCHVVNAGIPGSDPFFERNLIDSVFSVNVFHNYVVMLNFSDLYDYIFRGGEERFLADGTTQFKKGPWWEKIYQLSYIMRAFIHGVLKRDFTLMNKKELLKEKDLAVTEYAKLLTDLNQKIEAKNGKLCIVIMPYARQYKQNNEVMSEVLNYRYLEILGTTLNANGLKTINLEPILAKTINASNYLDYSWEIDGHYNAKGYQLLAEVLAKELQTKNICN